MMVQTQAIFPWGSGASKESHHLTVVGMGEHIYSAHIAQGKARLVQNLDIAQHSLLIARHIHDTLRCGWAQHLCYLFCTGTRRIQHHHFGMGQLSIVTSEKTSYLCGKK